MEAILEELKVSTTAVATLLVLDFVLNDKGLSLEVKRGSKGRANGMVRCLALRDETLVTLNDDGVGILDFPLADVRESLAADGSLLRRLRHGPALCPVVGKLLEERRLDLSGLWIKRIRNQSA